MERGRLGKGPAPAAGAVLAAVDSERAHRQEPGKGKAGDKAEARVAEAAAGRAVVEHESQNRREAAMPAGDGTGPMGMGPMTGRAAGSCAGYGTPGYMNPGFGRGMGRGRGAWGGRGGGRGGRNMFCATGLTGWQRASAGWMPPYPAAPTHEQELEALKGQAQYFENALGDLRKRIEEVEAQKVKK